MTFAPQPFIPQPNRGSLRNEKEKRSVNWPDIRGDVYASRELLETLMAKEGELVKISISAWRNVDKNGEKYLSLEISEPYEKKVKPDPKPEPEDDEDMPF